jgi:hypothetical protein
LVAPSDDHLPVNQPLVDAVEQNRQTTRL